MDSNLVVGGTSLFSRTALVNGASTFSSTVLVSGASTFADSVKAESVDIETHLNVLNNSNIGTLYVSGVSSLAAGVVVGGGYGDAGVTITETGGLSMDSNLVVGGTSTFSRTALVNGASTFSSTVLVSGASTFADSVKAESVDIDTHLNVLN